MSVRVHVKNYQSIEDAELVIDKFTVITGQNNSGKSATIRAIQGVFSNPGGDSFVRHGATNLSVQISFADGHTVKWEKGAKVKPTYTIDGNTIHPGRGVPSEVTELGIKPIQVGQSPVWPQLAPQFTGQVFLLDLPGSNIAEAVADVDRVAQLTQALRFAETDKRSASSELSVRRSDLTQLNQDLTLYQNLPSVQTQIAEVEALAMELQTQARQLETARLLQQRLAQHQNEISWYLGVRDVVVPATTQFQDAVKYQDKIKQVESLKAKLTSTKQIVSALSGVSSITVPTNPQDAIVLRDQIQGLVAIQRRYRSAHQAVQAAARAQEAVLSNNLDKNQPDIDKGQSIAKALVALRDFQTKITHCNADITKYTDEIKHKSQEALRLEAEISALLEEIGGCPVCGSAFSGSHVTHSGEA